MTRHRRADRRGGFTLVELLVVVLIVALLSAATLPAVLPAYSQRRVSEAARLIQAELSRSRDAAVRANAPRGIRFIPDEFNPTDPGAALVSSRLIALEGAPDYTEGKVERDFQPRVPTGTLAFYAPPPGMPPNEVFATDPFPNYTTNYPYLIVREVKFSTITIPGTPPTTIPLPESPTGWFRNLRQGDKLRFNDSGRTFTVAGPIVNPMITVPAGSSISTDSTNVPDTVKNPERYINYGPLWVSTPTASATASPPPFVPFEFLMLTNGQDDDGDGFIDEGFDGVNNDGDAYPNNFPIAELRGQPCIDPGFNGIDDNGNGRIDEWQELYLHFAPNGTPVYPGCPDTSYPNGGFPYDPTTTTNQYPNEFEAESAGTLTNAAGGRRYRVSRRPMVTEGAREVQLPTGVVLDLSTWNRIARDPSGNQAPLYLAAPERSRLPVDPNTGYVDVLIAPNGQVIQAAANGNVAPPSDYKFYHFWLTEVDGVADPVPLSRTPPIGLPMPKGSDNYSSGLPALKGERRLVSINTRNGQIGTTSLESFDGTNTSRPFQDAERGVREEP